jgi:hypothetical protein
MKHYITDKRKVNKGFTLNPGLLHKFTLNQLQELKTSVDYLPGDKNFIAILFQKTFEVD